MGYALGMGSVLIAVTVGAALFRGAVARWLRGSMLAISRASAMFLVGAGGYLIYYWVVSPTPSAGSPPADPLPQPLSPRNHG